MRIFLFIIVARRYLQKIKEFAPAFKKQIEDGWQIFFKSKEARKKRASFLGSTINR